MAVDLKSLIVQGKGLKDTLQYVPAEYNVIRTYSVYEFRNQDDYYTWKEISLRFLQLYYPKDWERFVKYSEEFEKHCFAPRYLANMIGVLEACDQLPSESALQLNNAIKRDEEIASVQELERLYVDQTTNGGVHKSTKAFYDWHAAAFVLFDKWFYPADVDWIKFQNIDSGNGYVLKSQYDRIRSSYAKLLARLKDGRGIRARGGCKASDDYSKPFNADNKINIFISYAHSDEKWLSKLKTHLNVLSKYYTIEYWEDTKLRGGDKWKEEISKAINKANVAILLVSTEFLASEFISNDELPPILHKAQEEGTRILPLIVSPCAYEDSELGQFQAINSPDRTLADLGNDVAAIERIYLKLNDCIKEMS